KNKIKMAPLPNKLAASIALRAHGGGDIVHELMLKAPHFFAKAAPAKVKSCQVLEGSYGTEGSIILWEYIYGGKVHTAKHVIRDVDEEKRHIGYEVIGGDLLELYKKVLFATDVETRDGVDFVTWTIEYELRKPDNPHPLSLVDFWIEFARDVEEH
ncbi:hypothetical protein M569_09819, partial [Genlisea aurea]